MPLIDTWAFLQLLKEDMLPYSGEETQTPVPPSEPAPAAPETAELFSVRRVAVFLLKFFGVIIAAWVVLYLIDCYGFLLFLGLIASLCGGFFLLSILITVFSACRR